MKDFPEDKRNKTISANDYINFAVAGSNAMFKTDCTSAAEVLKEFHVDMNRVLTGKTIEIPVKKIINAAGWMQMTGCTETVDQMDDHPLMKLGHFLLDVDCIAAQADKGNDRSGTVTVTCTY